MISIHFCSLTCEYIWPLLHLCFCLRCSLCLRMSKLLLSYLLGFLPYIKIMLYLSALPTNPIVTPNSHQHEGKNYTQLIFLHPYLAPSTVAWAQNGCSISGKKNKTKKQLWYNLWPSSFKGEVTQPGISHKGSKSSPSLPVAKNHSWWISPGRLSFPSRNVWTKKTSFLIEGE